jgi:tRNA threonylcarbamoyladenosine biosynthesis protein TsaE
MGTPLTRMENTVVQRFLEDEVATERLGATLAALCPPGTVVYLRGDLGAGKTTLVRGFVRSLGHRGTVKSPTYTLVEIYGLSGRTVYHWDLYRVRTPRELDDIGVRDYFDGRSTFLVEWPERGGAALPPADLDILLSYFEHGRRVRLEACSEKGTRIVDQAGENDNPG